MKHAITLHDAGQSPTITIEAETPREALYRALTESDDWTDPDTAWAETDADGATMTMTRREAVDLDCYELRWSSTDTIHLGDGGPISYDAARAEAQGRVQDRGQAAELWSALGMDWGAAYQVEVVEVEAPASTVAAIRAALSAAGLEPDNLGDDLTYSVPDGDEEEGAAYLRAIQAHLPQSITVEWTGDGNTGADGETTSDVQFTVEAAR